MAEMTNGNGDGVKSYRYDAYGALLYEGGTLAHNAFTYTGRELHPRSGLYYYRARWYDPELGRFLTQDPIGIAGGVNLYAYVGNDPVDWTDSLGLKTIQLGVSGTAGLAGGGTAGIGLVLGFTMNGFQIGSYEVAGGGGYAGGSLAGTVEITYSGNKNIANLSGPAITVGGSGGTVIGGLGGEMNIPLQAGAKSSYTGMFSPPLTSYGALVEEHGFYTHTWTNEWISVDYRILNLRNMATYDDLFSLEHSF